MPPRLDIANMAAGGTMILALIPYCSHADTRRQLADVLSTQSRDCRLKGELISECVTVVHLLAEAPWMHGEMLRDAEDAVAIPSPVFAECQQRPNNVGVSLTGWAILWRQRVVIASRISTAGFRVHLS